MTKVPALYEHCATIYAAMDEEATDEVVDGVPCRIYEGHLTRLFKDKLMSVPYYSHVKTELERMDCIRQLRRGGGAGLSKWLLVRPPTFELFDGQGLGGSPARRTRQDQLEQQVRDLAVQVQSLRQELELAKPLLEWLREFKNEVEAKALQRISDG
jgi:hypothetical protein